MENVISEENLITSTQEKPKKERIIAFDILRIIAALAVVMIHISCSFYNKNSRFLDGSILNALSRFAVPVFLMISGALMLDESKTITFKDTFKKVLFFVLILLLWNLFYAGYYEIFKPMKANKSIAISSFIKLFVLGNYHFWYMYLLLGLYLITPMLRLFVKKENMKYLLYYVLLAIIFTFLPTILNICFNIVLPNSLDGLFKNFVNGFLISGFFNYITYYILGWIIINLDIKKVFRNIIYSLGFISLLIMIVGTEFKFKKDGNIDFLFDNLKIFNFCYSLAIFTFVFYLFKNFKLNKKLEKIILRLSTLTFGIYLIHDVIINFLVSFIFKQVIINNLVHSIIIWTIVTLISFILCYIISLIPFVKKIIRG